MKKYGIVDSSNNYVRTFLSYDEAKYFRDMNSRLDWVIIPFHNSDYKSTIRQQASVRWGENTLNISKKATSLIKTYRFERRDRDSNPGCLSARQFSRLL